MEVKYIDSVTSEVVHRFNAMKDYSLINLPRIGEIITISDNAKRFYIKGIVTYIQKNYMYAFGEEHLHDVIITIKQNKTKKI